MILSFVLAASAAAAGHQSKCDIRMGSLVAAFPLWLLVRGVTRGVWNGRGVNVYRSERPSAFWFGIVMYAVVAAIIMSFPLYVARDTFADR
jgi:hypothetical protein